MTPNNSSKSDTALSISDNFDVNEYTKATNSHGADAWNILQIQSEFVQGFVLGHQIPAAVTVYGSARIQPGTEDYDRAEEVGTLLAHKGKAVVTGGGLGIMEAANKGAHNAGGMSVGLGIELQHEQQLNEYVDHPLEFEHFFSRKTMLVRYSQGFICFPGGFGSMDELFELLCLLQTEKKESVPVVLVGVSFWSGLIEWCRSEMLSRGLISSNDLDLFLITDSASEAVDYVVQHAPEHV